MNFQLVLGAPTAPRGSTNDFDYGEGKNLCPCCWRPVKASKIRFCLDCWNGHIKKKEDLPCPFWSKDMKRAWTKLGYHDRQWFTIESREADLHGNAIIEGLNQPKTKK